MTDDRDRRRYGDPLHPLASLEQSGEFETRTPVETPRGRRSVEVDHDQLRRDVDHGMPDWAEFAAMRKVVAVCDDERKARARRRKWLVGLLSGSGALFCAATVWVVTTIRDAGASAEAARVQTEIVRDSASRIRTLETEVAALRALVSTFLARRSSGPTNPPE